VADLFVHAEELLVGANRAEADCCPRRCPDRRRGTYPAPKLLQCGPDPLSDQYNLDWHPSGPRTVSGATCARSGRGVQRAPSPGHRHSPTERRADAGWAGGRGWAAPARRLGPARARLRDKGPTTRAPSSDQGCGFDAPSRSWMNSPSRLIVPRSEKAGSSASHANSSSYRPPALPELAWSM
jgi:hypothetical protein